MKKLTCLHLSDLHLETGNYDQKVVLEALFKDVKRQVDSGKRFDAIFFTGDLVGKGKYASNTVQEVQDRFIKPLLAASGLDDTRLFIAPGNHDVNVPRADKLFQAIYDSFNTHTQVNEFVEGIPSKPYYFEQLKDFNENLPKFTGARSVTDNAVFRSYMLDVGDYSVGIACLNSAWRATGKPNDGDYGHLLVGERQVELLYDSISNANLKLALIHHPLDWLTPYDKAAVQKAIYKKFDAMLHGHNHTSDAISSATATASLFISNAGCLYQSRTYFNGYSIIEFEPKTGENLWTVTVREYYEGRGEFDVCTRFAANGVKSHAIPKDTSSLSLLPSAEHEATVQKKVDSQLLSFAASDIAPKSIHNIFVEPPLSHLSEKHFNAEKTNGTETKYLSLQELAIASRPIIFMGSRESGRTTLLNFFCTKANDPLFFLKATHAAYIDLLALQRNTKAAILDHALQFWEGEYRKAEMLSLATAGRVVFCFDNLDLSRRETVSLISAFVNEYPLCQYFFTSEERIENALTEEEEKVLGFDCGVVYIHSFRRKHTRELVNKWFPSTPESAQEKVDAIVALMRSLNVPSTPFLISVLLWIKERNLTFTPTNHAAILDAFVDGLLDKLTESKDRSNTDSTIKRHYLSELAYAVHCSRKERWTAHELEKFTIDYFELKLLKSSTLEFLNELFDKGVLLRLGEEVCFKFDCLRSFFLAQKLADSKELREYALSRNGFLELGTEIDFYTALHRDQVDFLKKSIELVDEYKRSLSFDIDLSLFEKIGIEGSVLSVEMKESIKENLFGKKPTTQEQEQIFDDADVAAVGSPPPPSTVREDDSPAVSPHHFRGKAPLIDYFETLKIASAVLRNSELVNDPQLKKDIYDKLISMWSEVLLSVLLTVDRAYEQREKELAESFPQMGPIAITYFAKLIVPNIIFLTLKDSMGSAKLELVIKDQLQSNSVMVKQLLSTFLLVDLALPERLAALKTLLDQHGSHRYLLELVFFKLLELFVFKQTSESETNRIRQLVGDVFGRLNNSGTKAMNDARKSAFLNSLVQNEQKGRLGVSQKGKPEDKR